MRECSDTIPLRGRPKLRRSSGQCHKEVNTGHENEVAHLCHEINLSQPGLTVISEWLSDIAEVQDEMLLSQTRMLIARSRVTKKRPKAPRLPHQQQIQEMTIRKIRENVC